MIIVLSDSVFQPTEVWTKKNQSIRHFQMQCLKNTFNKFIMRINENIPQLVQQAKGIGYSDGDLVHWCICKWTSS